MEQAEAKEQRSGGHEAVSAYTTLAKTAPPAWRGWVQLRLARARARAGDAAGSAEALRMAALLPDSPGPAPSAFAARFELARGAPDEAARLYEDLSQGGWLLERSPYSFYESRLRELAGGRLGAGTLAREQRRQAMSRLLDRVVNGESGWMTEGTLSALATTASQRRTAATLTLENQWRAWLEQSSAELPRDIAARWGAEPPGPARPVPAVSLSSTGIPWSVWAEPRDGGAPGRAHQNRRRLLLSILVLVAGVLVFGSFVTVRIVRRDLRTAKLQSDFTAAVSHEFRSPLTGIRQLAEMLLAGRGAKDEERRRRYYEMISRECDRLTRLVENVLDLSRIEDGRRQFRFARIETAEWLHGLAAVAEQRRIVETEVPDALPAVDGDREALSSVVLNLLDNAIKYSPDGAPVRLRATGSDGWVTIAVQDAGRGIPPDEQHRVFDRFYRGKGAEGGARGVGLGLALVKQIADAHGARLRLESAPGAGSTFYLSLKASV
jgi:signal transduction histidine kinase